MGWQLEGEVFEYWQGGGEGLRFWQWGEECLGAGGIQQPIHYLLLSCTEVNSCTSLENGMQQEKKEE